MVEVRAVEVNAHLGRPPTYTTSARNFEGRYAVRGVLIASVVGLAVNIAINVWATLQGWLNAKAWGSTVVLLLLLLGGLYELSQRLFDDRS
jgi:hypothetical protein